MIKRIISVAALGACLSTQATFAANFDVSNDNVKLLFNKYRVAQPENIPWAGSYWSYRNNGIASHGVPGQKNDSPAERFDKFFKLGTKSFDQEMKDHSCEPYKDDEDTYKSCNGWWGHCNAWSAAAIKEKEPRKPVRIKNTKTGEKFEFSVADQKAYATEIYMSSSSLFIGNTEKGVKTGKWVFDPDSDEGKKVQYYRYRGADGKIYKAPERKPDGSVVTNYDVFWDISPKTFMLVFMNYVGARKTGVVIDRFTGDQVWNQPVVGYRFLPIRDKDIHDAEDRNGSKVYPVSFRVKMYWAEDGVTGDTISDKFDISVTSDTENVEGHNILGPHFSGRYLEFKLFFDAPIEIEDNGKKIKDAGNILGDGIWRHMETKGAGYGGKMNETHPDFIWLPTNLIPGGNANPHVDIKNARSIIDGRNINVTGGYKLIKKRMIIEGVSKNFSFPVITWFGWDTKTVKRKIRRKLTRTLKREGVKVNISDLILVGNDMEFLIELLDKKQLPKIEKTFKEAGYTIRFK